MFGNHFEKIFLRAALCMACIYKAEGQKRFKYQCVKLWKHLITMLPFSSFVGFLWGYMAYEPPLGLWDLFGLKL